MKSRALTALALIPPVLLAFAFPSQWVLLCLALLGAAICQQEFFGIKSATGWPVSLVGLLTSALVVYALAIGQDILALCWLAPAFLIGVVCASLYSGRLGFELGSLWFVAPLLAIPCAHAALKPASFGLDHATLLCLLPLWAGDTAAIFVGRRFGKRRMAPTISPGKTWEGALGNFSACVAAAALFGPLLHVRMDVSLVIGGVCAVFGQAGDLFESWLKRRADVKDSGSLLPGHGGVLDRVDSLLFVGVPVCLLLVYLR